MAALLRHLMILAFLVWATDALLLFDVTYFLKCNYPNPFDYDIVATEVGATKVFNQRGSGQGFAGGSMTSSKFALGPWDGHTAKWDIYVKHTCTPDGKLKIEKYAPYWCTFEEYGGINFLCSLHVDVQLNNGTVCPIGFS